MLYRLWQWLCRIFRRTPPPPVFSEVEQQLIADLVPVEHGNRVYPALRCRCSGVPGLYGTATGWRLQCAECGVQSGVRQRVKKAVKAWNQRVCTKKGRPPRNKAAAPNQESG